MAARMALKAMRLVSYKGFEDHRISLRSTNVLVGANNAGKSTALGALRLVVAMIPAARRTKPSAAGEVEGRVHRGWPITAAAIEASAFSGENIRHDFRPVETRVEVMTSTGVRLVASWPSVDENDEYEAPTRGMFFVFPPATSSLTPRQAAVDLVPSVGVVPTLTPLEDRESFVGDESVRKHATSRKASRYFRNALYRLEPPEWTDFRSFVYERTPEVASLDLRRSYGADDAFDLFYGEERTRHEREIGWAGDGIQIWLQALFYLWKNRDADVVILDEPDVFLHPDLQRRLARTLFGGARQTIVATHSVEILAEADPGSAVWIDRSRRTAERPRADGSLAMMGRRLGSGYELGVGRALRSRVVLFVEGDDAPILAILAQRLGFPGAASSERYATVPLGGFSKNGRAAAFSETMSVLGAGIQSFVVLDSDLRSMEAIDAEVSSLREAGALVHVWARRELENYLLSAGALAKVSGVPRAESAVLFESTIEGHRLEAFTTLQAQRLAERRTDVGGTRRHAENTVLQRAATDFESLWADRDGRMALVDAKAVIRSLNSELQTRGARTLNAHSLARSIPVAEIAPEVREAIGRFEELVTSR